MATYKLIQDIEADDKLLGPLSFRQFVFAFIAVAFLFFSYLLLVHHAELLDVVTLPVALFTGFLAFPFGKDQPTEIWAIAKLRFLVKPRRRIWAQSGIKELVTITVPKKVEVQRTNGLSQTEVRSRLQALADTIDSRGWSIKNASNIYQSPINTDDNSDRLISASALPSNVPDDNVPASEDLFDEKSNPIAQQFDQLLLTNTSQHRQQLMDNLNEVRANENKPAPQVQGSVVSAPTDNLPSEKELESKLKNAHAASLTPLNNMHALRKIAAPKKPPILPKPTSTTVLDPVIMNLAQRNDLNVNVISREANRALNKNEDPDEVLISLR